MSAQDLISQVVEGASVESLLEAKATFTGTFKDSVDSRQLTVGNEVYFGGGRIVLYYWYLGDDIKVTVTGSGAEEFESQLSRKNSRKGTDNCKITKISGNKVTLTAL